MTFAGSARRMPGAQLEFEYFRWLVDSIGDRAKTYWLLMKELYSIDFVWTIADDANRCADGLALRDEFIDQAGINPAVCGLNKKPCSVLEVLFALSRRCEIDIMAVPGEEDVTKWFWIMLEHLDILRCDDDHFDGQYVNQQVSKWLNRRYKKNGEGGIFPTSKPRKDQRETPIWTQMMSYINENCVW